MSETKPIPTHFTTVEGGNWNLWSDRNKFTLHDTDILSHRFHSVKFSDGSIFDMVDGWRKQPTLEEKKDGLWALEKMELILRRLSQIASDGPLQPHHLGLLADSIASLLKEHR